MCRETDEVRMEPVVRIPDPSLSLSTWAPLLANQCGLPPQLIAVLVLTKPKPASVKNTASVEVDAGIC